LFEAGAAFGEPQFGLAYGYFRHKGRVGPRAEVVAKRRPLRSPAQQVRDGGNGNAGDDHKAVNEYLSIRKVLVHRFLLCRGLEANSRTATLVQGE
jgi:hypothetical protein